MDRSDFYWLAASVWLILDQLKHSWWTTAFWAYLLAMAVYHLWRERRPKSFKLTINFGKDKAGRDRMVAELKKTLDKMGVKAAAK